MSDADKLLLTTSTYAYLEPDFLAAGDFERGTVERKAFSDGERYLRITSDCWGRDVVLLGGTPTDLDWLELYDLGHAVTRAGARSLSIVMPYFGYSTMERAVLSGEVVTAKTRAMLVSAIPRCQAGNRVFLFDLHTDGIEYYFGDTHVTRHVFGQPLVKEALARLMGDRPYVLGATDAGRAKWVQGLASALGVEPAFAYKQRDPVTGKLKLTGVNAHVKGREVVVYDDMIRTGATLLQAGRAYVAAGATKVHAITSHLVLPPGALDALRSSGVFDSVLGTNSHPGSLQLASTPGAVSSVAPHLVRALQQG